MAQYAPHHASFLPIYAAAATTPSSLNTGTQYKLDKESNWWIHCLTGNYLSRWYIHTIGEVRAFQRRQEAFLFSKQADAEAIALKLSSHSTTAAVASLGAFHELMGRTVRDAWWEFFFDMAGTFRDMYRVDMPHEENFALSFRYLTVPRWWFEQIGFWGAPGTPPADDPKPRPIRPINIPSEESPAAYEDKYPRGMDNTVYPSPYLEKSAGSVSGTTYSVQGIALLVGLSVAFGVAAGVGGVMYFQKQSRGSYLPIN